MPRPLKRTLSERIPKPKPPPKRRLKDLTMDMDIEEGMEEMDLSDQPSTSTSNSNQTRAGPVPSTSKATKNGTIKRSSSMRVTSADKNNNSSTSILSKRQKRTTLINQHLEPGTLFTFGQNDVGQLGIVANERKFPAKVVNLEDVKVVQVAAGSMHTIVLAADSKVYSFGCNDDFALGRAAEEEDEMAAPGLVDFKEKIIQVTAGDSHSTALTESGKVYIWGSFRNSAGDIGLKPGEGKIQKPTLMRFASDNKPEPEMIKVASGGNHVIALTSEGDIYGLGDGECGQLGRFVAARALRSRTRIPREEVFLKPEKIHASSLKHVVDVWAGGSSTYCKTSEEEIWAFGLNASSQLGWPSRKPRNDEDALTFDNTQNCQFVAKRSSSFNLSASKPWKQIALGEHHALALNEAGQVFALGDGKDGRTGLGQDKSEKSEPTLIPALEGKKCVSIACGGSTSYAVTESGAMYAWGFGENYQLANGKDDDADVPTLCRGSIKETDINGKVKYVSAGSQHAAIIIELPKDIK